MKLTRTPPTPLTQVELDLVVAASKCNDPKCKCGGRDPAVSISIVCKEHRGPVILNYFDGVLTVSCATCGFGMQRIAVAKTL